VPALWALAEPQRQAGEVVQEEVQRFKVEEATHTAKVVDVKERSRPLVLLALPQRAETESDEDVCEEQAHADEAKGEDPVVIGRQILAHVLLLEAEYDEAQVTE